MADAHHRRAGLQQLPWLLAFAAVLLWAGPASGQPYAVYGTSDIDLNSCRPVTPTEGTTEISFWVHRAPTVAGPAEVRFANLPPGISVAVQPSVLTFPGAVIGQKVTATFTAPVESPVADTILTLETADRTNRVAHQLLLHGSCPRASKAFTIRGSFFSQHEGTILPVEGALVYIYRDVSWQADPWVAITKTEKDGSFSRNVWNDVEGTYYAKLILNDGEGVYLRDWWSSDAVTYNSVNRGSNAQPLIDLGATLISRDGGNGTAKPSIWQGGRAAFQEFIATTGRGPPTGAYEIVIQSTAGLNPWTARSTTNWEDNHYTYKYEGSSPIPIGSADYDAFFSPFINYATNFHEFGHALRHTVDGDMAHLIADSARWTYIRKHDLCGSDPGYVETEGFGFNEGWAEFWGRDDETDIAECKIDLADLRIEGSVDYDLLLLARQLTTCLSLPPGKELRVRAQRRHLFDVLNRGSNIIHSQGEFRSNFEQQFPGCTPPAPGSPIPPGVPLSLKSRIPVASSQFHDYYRLHIDYLRARIRSLSSSWKEAQIAQARLKPCRNRNCDYFVETLVRPHQLQAQIRLAQALEKLMSHRYEAERKLAALKTRSSFPRKDVSHGLIEAFQAQRKSIILDYLRSSADALQRGARNGNENSIRQAESALRRTLKRVQMNGPSSDELANIVPLDRAPADDAVSIAKVIPTRPAPSEDD